MERSDYWAAFVRAWWLIAALALIGLAVGLLMPRSKVQTYYVSECSFGSAPPAPAGASGNLFGGGITSDQILYYASGDQVMEATAKLSGLYEPAWEIRDQIQLVPPPSPNGGGTSNGPTSGLLGVIDVKVQSPTAAQSVAIANAFNEAMDFVINSTVTDGLQSSIKGTEATLGQVNNELATNSFPPGLTAGAVQVEQNDLQNYLAQLVITQPASGFEVLQSPTVSNAAKGTTGKPTNNVKVRAAAGFGIGIILGALVAIGLWLLDKRLKTFKRAQTAFGYPVVAEIPSDSSDTTEPYRMLWLSVFREPLPLPPEHQNERLYEGESPLLSGPGSP